MNKSIRWAPIPGYEGAYEISDRGDVRSLARVIMRSNGKPQPIRERILRQSPQHRGHLRVALSGTGRLYVHRLVLLAFVGPPSPGQEACHWNDIPDDNRLENLRWATRSENVRDGFRNGRIVPKKTHCIRGHHLTPETVYQYPKKRQCIKCNDLKNSLRYRKKAA